MQITLGQQYNVGEKPTVILCIYILLIRTKFSVLSLFVVVVVSHIQRIGCQPEKNYFTRWPIPLVVC